jgi:hypothetical protein
MLTTLRDIPPTGFSTISSNFLADLRWWKDMLPSYNGRLLIQRTRTSHSLYIDIHDPQVTAYTLTHHTTAPIPTLVATTDHKWAHRELFAVLLALTLWAHQWRETNINIYCIDPAKLQVLVHGKSRNDSILAMARRIWLITAGLDIALTPILRVHHVNHGTISVAPPVIDLG